MKKVSSLSAWIELLVVAGATAFLIWVMHPNLLFNGSTTLTGGDTGAHVALPYFLIHHLLPHFAITGWNPQWFNGFPSSTFYFPLPSLITAFFNIFVNYNLAFKLVTALGILALPVSAWAFGKLAGLKNPAPACLAVSSLLLLFDTAFSIYGGNIPSTLAGEYDYEISLCFALIFLGLLVKGVKSGKHRSLAAILLAASALSHMVPAFFAGVGAVVLILMEINWLTPKRILKQFWWAVTTALSSLALIGFWVIPFYFRLPYATNMGWTNITTYVHYLFPSSQRWAFILASIAFVISIIRRHKIGIFLGIMAGISALAFVTIPEGRLYNPRVLPFWTMCIYFLVGLFIAEVVDLVGIALWLIRRQERVREAVSKVLSPLGSLVYFGVVIFLLLVTLIGASWLPFYTTSTSTQFAASTAKPPLITRSYIPSWIVWNYSGYQSKPAWPQYHGLITTMERLSHRYGCGETMYEYNSTLLNQFGTPMALMLLPYWTHGCIDTNSGLLFESSATTPYHFINQAELSAEPSDPMVGLPYSSLDVPLGVQHLQMMGIRYFMAFSPEVVSIAQNDPNLSLIATSGPWPVSAVTVGSSAVLNQVTWDIYLVHNSKRVSSLANQPVVVKGLAADPSEWMTTALSWYDNPSRWPVPITDGGPKNFQRVTSSDLYPTPRPVARAKVSNISIRNESLSFTVANTGTPVLIKVSYFPNWQAKGALGPWRVAPNFMVVIPKSHNVTLVYATTPLDIVGWLITLLGLIAVALMAFRKPLMLPPVQNRRKDRKGPGEPSAGPPPASRSSAETGGPDNFDAVFKAYDIRGTVDSQLDDVTAWAIGRAFARFIGARDKGASQSSRPKILMARDMRSSGVWLSRAFAGGAMLEGVKVIDMGLSSTDMMYFASGKLNVGGAMFTASHNPAAYNGIKLCLSGARPVGEDSGLAQIKQFAKEVAPQTSNLHVPEESQLEHVYLLEAFADHVRSFVDISALKPLKVVADVANGMGGLVVPKIFEKLPFQLSILYPELDGTFPNHPADPIQPENLVDLKKAVLEDKADIGLAFDGDADRVFLVDEKAQPISGSTTTALVAKAMLEKHPGSTILYNLICSKVVPETIEHYGGTAIRTRVGHSFIKAVMAKTSAVFGGEHSGHYYFRDNYRADSGLIAALIVLEVLSNAQVPLSELCKPFQKYAASGEINTKVPDPQAVIERVAAYFQKIPTAKLGFTDGLTVELENWWFNLRPSNTEPLLRLNLEAADEQMCKSKTEEIRSLLR